MNPVIELEQVANLAQHLSPQDKIKLVEQVMSSLAEDWSSQTPKRSLYGLWAGANVSEEDIAEVRREMMANFPRDDIG